MTRSKQGPGVAELSTLTSHLVTRDPAAAASWYGSVLGAVEEGRVTLPGGRVLTVELRFGDSGLAIGDEFPDLGIVSPLTLGGTYGALHLAVGDAGRSGSGRWMRARKCSSRCMRRSGATGPASSSTRSGTAGPSTSTSGMCRPARWPGCAAEAFGQG